jgi:hypothetical protein
MPPHFSHALFSLRALREKGEQRDQRGQDENSEKIKHGEASMRVVRVKLDLAAEPANKIRTIGLPVSGELRV